MPEWTNISDRKPEPTGTVWAYPVEGKVKEVNAAWVCGPYNEACVWAPINKPALPRLHNGRLAIAEAAAVAAPSAALPRLIAAARAVLDHRYQMGAPMLPVHNELETAIREADTGLNEGAQRG